MSFHRRRIGLNTDKNKKTTGLSGSWSFSSSSPQELLCDKLFNWLFAFPRLFDFHAKQTEVALTSLNQNERHNLQPPE